MARERRERGGGAKAGTESGELQASAAGDAWASRTPRTHFARFLAITAANPLTIASFAAVAAALSLNGPAAAVAFAAGVGIASAAWHVLLTLAAGHAGRWMTPRVRTGFAVVGRLAVLAIAAHLALGQATLPLIPHQRHLFELPGDVAYLNCAGLAPPLRSVRVAAERALDRRAAPWSIRAADWFDEVERLRALFARVAGADPDGVAIVPSTSYGLGVAAANTEGAPGDRVVLLACDFPSNVHTWTAWAERRGAEVVTVERHADHGWTEPLLDSLDERVRVVSVPSVHWVDGSTVELERVARSAREVDALLVVDATQSLGAMPLDLAAVRPNYLVAAGYKWLLGPLGTSYLYVAPEHRDGRPLEENWANRAGAEHFEDAAPPASGYRPGARRFDAGQRSNFVLVPMAIAALQQVLNWGVERIAAALEPVTIRIEAEARARGLDATPARLRAPHMLGIELPKAAARRWAAQNVHVEILGSVMRVSPHMHVTDGDLEMLFAELKKIDSQPISGFAGTVLTPGHHRYDSARAMFNGAVDRHPALIAEAAGARDVSAALAHGREHDLQIAVRAGGHSGAGCGVIDDGLVIDVRPCTG